MQAKQSLGAKVELSSSGVFIKSIEAAGLFGDTKKLLPKDRILKVNGQDLCSLTSLSRLRVALDAHAPSLVFTVARSPGS
jgi:hypothetical protein